MTSRSVFSFDDAKTLIKQARRILECGDGLNSIGNYLLSVESYSICAWLDAKGITETGSFSDSYLLFLDMSSNEISQKVSEITAGWSSLDFRLLGDPDGVIEALPIDKWKELATTYISDAQKLVSLLESDAASKS